MMNVSLESFLVAIAIVCLSACSTAVNEKDTPPNVVIIFVDDMGYADLECYGGKVPTPNLNLLAAEGARLTNFHVAQPVCSASRAALLTGCYPNRIGMHGALMPNAGSGLNPEETTLAEMFKDKGYTSAAFGKWHLGDHPSMGPNAQGFDSFFGIQYSNDMWPNHPWQGTVFDFPDLLLFENEDVIDTLLDQSDLTTQITERAVDFIDQNKENPFFLYIPHPQPHVPLFVSNKFRGTSESGIYGDVVMELDWSVGQIMKSLKHHGLEKNTIVVFASDNGPWLSYGTHAGDPGIFREGKGTNFEGGTRVPFLIRYPNKIPAGQTVDVPVVSIDILPSLAHIADLNLPDRWIDGKNAWHVFDGSSTQSPQENYFFFYHINKLEAVLSGQWKLILPHQYRTLNNRVGGTNGLPVPYEQNVIESAELYNLNDDPEESRNLALEYPEILDKLLKKADSINQKIGINGTDLRAPGKVNL